MTFCNFIRSPASHECAGYGALQKTGNDAIWLKHASSGISKILSLDFSWQNTDVPKIEAWENPNIPAGYTYLLQLLAHDCVFSSPSTGAMQCPIGQPSNTRINPLQLETIYGGGPDVATSAYISRGSNALHRNRLKVGHAQLSNLDLRHNIETTDLVRTRPTNLINEEFANPTDSLIADPRNDVHALIAQLTTLFHRLHNLIVDQLELALPAHIDVQNDLYAYQTYLIARNCCVRIFRNIIQQELLPLVLHPEIAQEYLDGSNSCLSCASSNQVPIEFSQALRFGHSMVRPNYIFNDENIMGEDLVDMMLTTSAGRPWRLPLDQSWMPDWSLFFPPANEKSNLSRRIGPSISSGLYSKEVFDHIDSTQSPGLIYRDLLNGYQSTTWSVSGLIDEINRKNSQLLLTSRLSQCEEVRFTAIKTWLKERQSAARFSDEELNAIASDPPLVFYILFEAAIETNGTSLGQLGSVIIADTLFSLMKQSCQHPNPHTCEISDLVFHLFGNNQAEKDIVACTPNVTNMSELIRLVR